MRKHTIILVCAICASMFAGICIHKAWQTLALDRSLPKPLSMPATEGDAAVIASADRFVIVRMKTKYLEHEQYFIWDSVSREVLSSFGETNPHEPLTTRNLYRPGSDLLTMVTTVFLDEHYFAVKRVVCSPGKGVTSGSPNGEEVYDTNMDGIFDRLVGTSSTPDPLLLRTASGWVQARSQQQELQILVEGEWRPARMNEKGLWEATQDTAPMPE